MSEFVDSLPDLFYGLGTIRVKRMFGGHGVYADDVIFAIVDDDVLYLKADEITAPLFLERNSRRFEYVKDGKVLRIAYFSAPAEVLEDPEEALRWGRLAVEATLRSPRAWK